MRDAVREVWQSCAVQTTVCQNTEAEAYLLWNPQPVDVAEEQHDVLRCLAENTSQAAALRTDQH